MSTRKIINMRGKPQTQKRPKKAPKKQKPQRPRRRASSVPRQNRQRNNGNNNRMPRVQQPFLAPTTNRGRGQNMKSKTVPFREELGAITGSIAFAATQYPINPGQAASFPWLALEAKQWEKYRIRKLCYEYTPQVTEFSTNGIGSIVIGFDADASDAPPNDLIHALNCDPRSFNLPCKKVVLDVPPRYMNLMTDGYFVRPGNLPGQSDIKTYDCGNINISTVGQASAATIGILAVSYVVDFFIPILEPVVGAPTNNSVTQLIDSKHAITSTVAYQPLLASVATTALTITNGLNVVNTAGSVVPPAGNYLLSVSININNATGSIVVSYLDVLKNAIIQAPGTGGHTYQDDNTAFDTDNTMGGTYFLSMNGTDAITLSTATTFGTGTATATTVFTLVAL